MDSSTLQRIRQAIQGDTRCPLMPAEAHCWHEQMRLWDDPFPPPMQCCWCGCESVADGAVPRRHGPCVPEE